MCNCPKVTFYEVEFKAGWNESYSNPQELW